MYFRRFIVSALLILSTAAVPVSAQEIAGYKYVPRTIHETKPVTVTKWVNETVSEKQKQTTWKKVIQTETRQRVTTEYKPVQKTSEREERTVVRKPVVETLFRKKETRETTYETVTELRDEQYTVRKPIVETQMREERVTVRKPVTEQLIEVQQTTTFKPVLKETTQYVAGATVVEELQAIPDPNQRPRMRLLEAGYYTDPATGQSVYRRRGLHWVQPSVVVPAATTVPTLVPQQTNEWSYVPETTELRKPVEVTRFVEQTETRSVPVEVRRTIESVETRKVPVTIQVPRVKVTVEDVPYTQTTYREEVTVRKVPFTKTEYERVETVEPYTIEVPRWIEVVEEVDVPRTVRRRVEYTEQREVPRTVMFKIPVDDCGNEIGEAIPAYGDVVSANKPTGTEEASTGTGTTLNQQAAANGDAVGNSKSILNGGANEPEKTETGFKEETAENYQGELKLVEPKETTEMTLRKPAVDVPDTSQSQAAEKLSPIPAEKKSEEQEPAGVADVGMPEVTPSGSGDESAADPPVDPAANSQGEVDDESTTENDAQDDR